MEEEYKLNIQFKTPESEEKIANKEKEMNKLQVKKRMQSLVRNKPIVESTNSLIDNKLSEKTPKNETKTEKDDGIITTRITPYSVEEDDKITQGMNEINLKDEEKPEEKVVIEFDNKENAEKEQKVVLKFENEEALHSKDDLHINFDEDTSNNDSVENAQAAEGAKDDEEDDDQVSFNLTLYKLILYI